MTNIIEARFKRVIRDGKVVKKVQCKPGYKAEGTTCVKITAQEARIRSKAGKKAARKRKGKHASATRARKISLRIRKSKGL